jgi:hypothetical protein
MNINFRTRTIRVPASKAENERSYGIEYAEAKRIASKARDKYRGAVLPGRLGQTRLREAIGSPAGKTYCVRFHRTDVVTFHRSGWITLDNGGWYSPSTKERIETYAGVDLISHAGDWYLSAEGDRYWSEKPTKGARWWKFTPGMRIRHVKGWRIEVKGAGKAFTAEELQAEMRRVTNERARKRRAERKAEAEYRARLEDAGHEPRRPTCWECAGTCDPERDFEHDGHAFCDEDCLAQYCEATEADTATAVHGAGGGHTPLSPEQIRERVLARTPEENRALFASVKGGRV